MKGRGPHVLPAGPVLKPPVFPYATSATLEEAPARCPRCGGPWRLVSDGYACQQCPKHWLAGDMLATMVGATLDHEAGGHIASERTYPKRSG